MKRSTFLKWGFIFLASKGLLANSLNSNINSKVSISTPSDPWGSIELVDLDEEEREREREKKRKKETLKSRAKSKSFESLLKKFKEDQRIKEEEDKKDNIWDSIYSGNFKWIKKDLENGFNPNRKNTASMSPLHYSILLKKLNLAELLLEYKVDIDERNSIGYTALHKAVLRKNLKLAKLLLEKKAFADAKDLQDNTALLLSVDKDQDDITKLLLKHEADPNKINNNGYAPLHVAARKGKVKIVRLLVEADANTDLQDDIYEWTPLHYAVLSDNEETVAYLLKHQASIINMAEDDSGQAQHIDSPLHLAITYSCSPTIIKLLLLYGSDLHAKNADQQSALQLSYEKITREYEELARKELNKASNSAIKTIKVKKIKRKETNNTLIFDALGRWNHRSKDPKKRKKLIQTWIREQKNPYTRRAMTFASKENTATSSPKK